MVSSRLFYNGRDVTFSRYSEYWRQVKSLCVTQLLSTKRVHSFQNIREEEVALLIQSIEYPHSKIVNLSELLVELTRNVLYRGTLGSKDESGHEGISYKTLLGEVTDMLGYSRSVGDFFPLLGWVDWLNGLKGKVEKTAIEVDTFLEGVLRDHPSNTASNNSHANKDLVSFLLEIQKTVASSIDKESIKALIWVSNSLFLRYNLTFGSLETHVMLWLVLNFDENLIVFISLTLLSEYYMLQVLFKVG